MNSFGVFDCPAPRSLGGVHYRREILLIGKSHRLARKPAAHSAVPSCDVQHQFPDGMSMLHGPRCSLRGGHAVKDLKERIAMPRVTAKCTAELVGDAGSFGHGGGYKNQFSTK